ncbi:hypothetical protein GCM10027271_53520 [Saccharopolyspora gloriosae]
MAPGVCAVSLVIVSFVLDVVRDKTASGEMGRNPLFGIRTKATKASDAAWLAGHRAAGDSLRTAARTGYAAAALTAVLLVLQIWWGVEPWVALVAGLAGLALQVLHLLFATTKANEAARNARPD